VFTHVRLQAERFVELNYEQGGS